MTIQKQKYENFTVLNCDWQKEEDLIFVLIPLKEEFNDLFENGIKSVVEDLGLRCEKADTIIHTDVNLNKICENIIGSKCLIADLTGGNPNVFYEAGLAHALDKKVILIAQNRSDVPFDLKVTRSIEYKDAINLKSQLRNTLISLLDLPKIPEISEIEEKITKNSVEIYIASSDIFAHGWGKQINDPNAREGIAWTIDEFPDSIRHIIWGPYRALPERGEYIAYFKLKIDDNLSENDVCEIDVWSNSTPSIGEKCRKRIKGKDFDQPDEYKFFEIEFKYTDELDMEYRLTLLRKSRITIDYIGVLKKKLSVERVDVLDLEKYLENNLRKLIGVLDVTDLKEVPAVILDTRNYAKRIYEKEKEGEIVDKDKWVLLRDGLKEAKKMQAYGTIKENKIFLNEFYSRLKEYLG